MFAIYSPRSEECPIPKAVSLAAGLGQSKSPRRWKHPGTQLWSNRWQRTRDRH